MSDLSITAANVKAGANAVIGHGQAGATITQGQQVYLDPTVRKWLLADSNSATVAARHDQGTALNAAALDQPLAVQTGGDLTLGATLTPGVAYYLSATPGGVCPVADVGAGDYVCQIGLAKSSTVLSIDIQFPGVSN